MTLHRESPAITADEQLEQLFIDNVEVWFTFLSSPAVASTAAATSESEALSCCVSPTSPQSAVEAALGAQHRLTRWVEKQSLTETRARSLRRSVASAGVAW